MGKQVVTTNKFPVNTSEGTITGIGNLNISNTTGAGGIVAVRADIPCTNVTDNFKIQISFTTYRAWNAGDLLIGDYDKSNDNNDFRFFCASGTMYYDYNSNRIMTSGSPYFGKVCNFEIGNYYIKNLDTGSKIRTGTAQTIGNHLSRLSFFGYSDGAIIHSLKVWKDGSTLTYDIIPYKDSRGYGLYDQVSLTMVYRVTNNNQVQTTLTVTQVQNIGWLDTLINKAYMGSNLIYEKTTIPSKLYIINASDPSASTGTAVNFLPFIKNDAAVDPLRFEIDFIGFKFTGGTIIRQCSSTTQGTKGTEYNQRFFATSTSAYYIDINYGRVNGNGPNCYNTPQHWSFCCSCFQMGSGLDLGWNNNYYYVVLWDHDKNQTILSSGNSSLSYNNLYGYSWHTWGYDGEIYGFNSIKVYTGYNAGSYNKWTLIRNWQAMENANGSVYFHDSVKNVDVSLPGMYRYDYVQN